MTDDARRGHPPGTEESLSELSEESPTEMAGGEEAGVPEARGVPMGEGSPEEGEETAKKSGKKKEKKEGKKEGRTGSARGVETMFRTNYRTHLDLSNLADNKANIMISINGIIISILLASIYPRIIENRLLLVPTAVLSAFCLLSLVYAVLAARPRVTRSNATLDDVRKGKANILFFGTFANMPEEDFLQGMKELIRDPERTYDLMAKDIYGLGSVLETKYRLLRASYTIFMFGLILGVILFLVAFTWGSRGAGMI